MSVGLFALAAGAMWVSRGREPERNFGNTLQEEVRRSLALVDYQLSLTRHWIFFMLGTVFTVVGVWLFSWTLVRSQEMANGPSAGGWFWYAIALAVLGVWTSSKTRDAMRKATPKLELRQRRLRELLAALDASE